jgi:cytochrome b
LLARNHLEPLMPQNLNSISLARVRVWDLPTRLFHWLLALAMIGSVVSAEVGGAAMVWHTRLGVLVMGLLIFRVIWGVVGGHWSRFVNFFYLPTTIYRYLRGKVRPGEHFDVGHNPLGSLSVWGLLGLTAVQVATGLVSDDEIATTGPLNKLVSTATGLLATSWHKTGGKYLLIVLVLMHVAAIVFYWKKKGINLVQPMVQGDKFLPAGTPASSDGALQRVKALVVAALAVGVMIWVYRQGA